MMKTKYLVMAAAIGVAPAVLGGSTTPVPVDLELSLVVDVSGSVSDSEYDLQMIGYANAFANPQVEQAVLGGSLGQVSVNMVFFDDSATEGIGWNLLNDNATITSFSDSLRNFLRPSSGGTNIPSGIDLATSTITTNNYEGTRKVIDVSGDGSSGTVETSASRDAALAAGVDTINGLPILDGSTTLEDFYRDNVVGGTNAFNVPVDQFEDFEREVLRKLLAEITGTIPVGSAPILAAMRQAQLMTAMNSYQDINSRLQRARAGFRGPEAVAIPTEVFNDKGAKGGMPQAVIENTLARKPWEVFGSISYFSANVDSQSFATQYPFLPGYDVDFWTGTVGVEYDINHEWSVGGAVLGRDGEIDMDGGSDIDTDGWGLAVYGSFYRQDAFNLFNRPVDCYADLMYGYSDDDYDSTRLTGGGAALGSTSGDSNLVEFNTGLNFENGAFLHGPFARIAYIDGTVDGFTEAGPGAVTYPDADIESWRTQLGYQVSYRLESATGMVIPHARAAWEHEFEDDEVIVSGLNLGSPDEDVAVVGAGVLWQFHPSAYAGLDGEARFGDRADSYQVSLRVGVTF